MALRHLHRFAHDESGQDLIEYTLLVAFIVLASAVLIAGSGTTQMNAMWQHASSQLANGVVAAS